MTIKLTEAQERALRFISNPVKPATDTTVAEYLGYSHKDQRPQKTIWSLCNRGLIELETNRQCEDVWEITPAGRAWLAAKDKGE